MILSFLCLFAGNKPGFMEDYHMLTLNTSRIGQNLLTTSNLTLPGLPGDTDTLLTDLLRNTTTSLTTSLDQAIDSLAEVVGVEDFYSAHLLTYCRGTYTPSPLPNATLSRSRIRKNTTACSESKAWFHFDPSAALSRSLNSSRVNANITLSDLRWPPELEDGILALRVAWHTAFVLYILSIGLAFLVFLSSLAATFLSSGRLSASLNLLLAVLALGSLLLASAIVTAVVVKGSDVVNRYGFRIGVEAHRGGKFLGITWAATGCMGLGVLLWCFECAVGRRGRKRTGVVGDGAVTGTTS